MKVCNKCKEEKSLTSFHKHSQSRDGVKPSCKVCANAHRKEYHIKNLKVENSRDSLWYSENKGRAKENFKNWAESNRGRSNSIKSKYRASKKSSTPVWGDIEKIKSIYDMASFLTSTTFGDGYHVDHIIPLQGVLVSGLHVHNNLQILRAEDNLSKSNKFKVHN